MAAAKFTVTSTIECCCWAVSWPVSGLLPIVLVLRSSRCLMG